jgi:hypothetical protein
MPANVRAKVTAELRDGLSLASFVPHPDVRDNELTGRQELVFNIVPHDKPLASIFQVNGQPFVPDRIDRVLMLGGADEWTLKSDFVSHPFHIHVNPFQVVEIRNAKGQDVSGPDADDDGDPQYRGLKGVWKDTLWVKNPGTDPTAQYTLKVRTRYQRYIGDYVLHCHILDHEDQGMMQRVRVALTRRLRRRERGAPLEKRWFYFLRMGSKNAFCIRLIHWIKKVSHWISPLSYPAPFDVPTD